MTPVVSIITPAYNASKSISQTIESVLAQTFQSFEMIIIDDCSTDNTREIISGYASQDSRIVPLFLEQNGRVANARNKGIELATGKYIAFLDSDDLWYSDKLEKQVAYMEQHNYQFTFTNYDKITPTGDIIKTIHSPVSKADYKVLLRSNFIGCLTVMVDASIMKKEHMPHIGHEDYATWLNLLRYHVTEAYLLDEVLAQYRFGEVSVSSNKLRAAKWAWNIYKNHQKMNVISSLFHMFVWGIYALRKYGGK